MAITQTREIQNPAYGLAVFFKIKKEENLERVIVLLYLHSQSKQGSIAQLVQSICLTSRGSAVRTRVLPPNRDKPFREILEGFFISGVNMV